MNAIARLGIRVRRGFGRVVPEPFAVAVILTLAVFSIACFGGVSPGRVAASWAASSGVWGLLEFTMQMCLMLVLGTALASAPSVVRTLSRLVGLARTPRQLVGLTAFVAIALSLLNWSLTLVGGAVVARVGGQLARDRGWRLHYPLLCAAGYSGMMTWHGGLSGSAPLKAATESGMVEILGADLAARVGPVALNETLFGGLNVLVSGVLLALGPLLFMALCPAAGTDPEAKAAPPYASTDSVVSATEVSDEGAGLLGRIENSSLLMLALAALIAAGLGHTFADRGLGGLSFNTVNLALWGTAILAHRKPGPFLRACEDGARSCAGVMLQFPLYAGIMGMMGAAGLSVALANLFAEAGPSGLGVLTFVSAGALNLVVPSGGGQWAVQGPILMEAAVRTGLPPGDVIMAMAYGDQWTNMLQPFWALPLLAITGVRAREIIGYAALWMVTGGVVIVAALLLLR